MSNPILEQQKDETAYAGRFMTVMHNNDHTAYDLVLLTVMAATDCGVEEAEIETWEAHHYGKAPIHFATQPECERVAKVIGSIGVTAEVCPEWIE